MKPVGLSLLWILLLLGQFTFLYYLWGTVPELHEEGSITVHTNNQRNFVENFPGEPPVRIEEIIKIEEVIKYVPVENVDESECIFTDEYQKTIQKLMEKIQESHASIKYLSQKLEKQQIPQIPVGGGVKKSVENFGENPNKNIIKISTFNIWNVNQPWQRRMEELVKIIRSKNIEILGLQEVRTTKRSSLQLIQPINTSLDGLKINNTLEITNISDIQLHFIQRLLPDFKWSVYMPTANMPDGAQEGIAVIILFYFYFKFFFFIFILPKSNFNLEVLQEGIFVIHLLFESTFLLAHFYFIFRIFPFNWIGNTFFLVASLFLKTLFLALFFFVSLIFFYGKLIINLCKDFIKISYFRSNGNGCHGTRIL